MSEAEIPVISGGERSGRVRQSRREEKAGALSPAVN